MEQLLGGLLGRIAGKVIEEGADLTRDVLAARMREVAEELERGDVVSDDAIDGLKRSLDTVRALQNR